MRVQFHSFQEFRQAFFRISGHHAPDMMFQSLDLQLSICRRSDCMKSRGSNKNKQN